MDAEPEVERERATRLFLKHQQMLQEYIHGLVRHAHDAEDLFQEVGVEIMHKATVPADPEAFGAWSRGVARNMVLHYWRTQRRRQAASVHLLNLVDQAYEEAEPESDELDSRRHALRECLGHLPDHSRSLLEWRYVKDACSQELAERFKQSAAAVRMNLMRLRKVLFDCVQKRIAQGTAS